MALVPFFSPCGYQFMTSQTTLKTLCTPCICTSKVFFRENFGGAFSLNFNVQFLPILTSSATFLTFWRQKNLFSQTKSPIYATVYRRWKPVARPGLLIAGGTQSTLKKISIRHLVRA
jgi:hypothetical protein